MHTLSTVVYVQVFGPSVQLLCESIELLSYTVLNTCMHNINTLEFTFGTITNPQAIDALVFALSIELFLNNRIESTQPSANQLVFDTDAHCTFAQLALCSDTRYTLTRLG